MMPPSIPTPPPNAAAGAVCARIDLAAADGRSRLDALRVQLVSQGEMVSPAGRQRTIDVFGEPLTPRQVEVLALVVAGLPNKLIARRLDIAESTVKIHVSVILRELKVTSRTQALIAVAKAGVRL